MHGVFSIGPRPAYMEGDDPIVAEAAPDQARALLRDIKYHLLELYSDRFHSLENTLDTTSTAGGNYYNYYFPRKIEYLFKTGVNIF